MATVESELSEVVRREITKIATALPATQGPWECHYLKRPHFSPDIADTGGAMFYSPAARFIVLHYYAKVKTGLVRSCIHVSSFLDNERTITTTNNPYNFDLLPGTCSLNIIKGKAEDLLRCHQITISEIPEIIVFPSFESLVKAHDRKEQLQAEWDKARGVYEPVDPH